MRWQHLSLLVLVYSIHDTAELKSVDLPHNTLSLPHHTRVILASHFKFITLKFLALIGYEVS
jgi:hypothetical protein